ncbi:tumor protein D52-like isoform X3 [Lineus longissimus]|uniref:tumor protein D52-like isoform X3 n=1 Tax=Lineus longissimus TaxID=88925 RepID=UPI00315D3094
MDQRLTEENMYMSNSGAASVEPTAPTLTPDQPSANMADLSDINITQDNQYFETADIAQPDLTSSGDNVHSMALDPAEEERKKEELRAELKKIEDEINVLRPVLEGKVKRAQALKRELGITPLNQVKHDISEGVKHLKESTAYQKTSETLSAVNEKITQSEVYKKTNETFESIDKSVRDSAAYKKMNEKLHVWNEKVKQSPTYQRTSEKVSHAKDKIQQTGAYQKTNVVLRSATEKTSSALSTAGASVSRKLSDIRNSNKFRSFEERMGSAYSSVKRSKSMGMLRMRSTSHAMPSPSSKVVGSKSEDNFEDVLNSTAAANGGGQPQTEQPLPEEKVPL